MFPGSNHDVACCHQYTAKSEPNRASLGGAFYERLTTKIRRDTNELLRSSTFRSFGLPAAVSAVVIWPTGCHFCSRNLILLAEAGVPKLAIF